MAMFKKLRERIYGKRRDDRFQEKRISDGDAPRKSWLPRRQSTELRPTIDTQPATRGLSQERDIVVGFDFGTSCTKVVLQDAALRIAYAVDFSSWGHEPFSYLVPTQLRILEDGSFSLDRGVLVAEHLKINLMENPQQEHEISVNQSGTTRFNYAQLVSAYIALVLQLVRGWFLINHGKQYRNVRIIWQMNIGIPSSSYDDQALVHWFRLVALAGWNVSVHSERITVQNVAQACERAEALLSDTDGDVSMQEPELHPDLVQAVPEVIGEIEGYAKSPMRQGSTHLLVDVGATTLDVAGFNLRDSNALHKPDAEDFFAILCAEVAKLGVYELHKKRLSAVADRNLVVKDDVANLTEMGQLPAPDRYGEGEAVQTVMEVDREFLAQVSLVIRRVVHFTKTKRNPTADVWKTGLPVFLCGGGSQVDLYRQAVEESYQALSKNYALGQFELRPLPQPDNMRSGKLGANYNRLAVAYGLSFPFLDLGTIIPPSACEDVPDNRRPVDHEYVSKDIV